MPGYIRQPYVRPAYQPGDNLGQLLQLRGQQQAQAALRQGETSAQLWGNLGNTIANTVQGVVKARDEQKEKDTLTKQDTAFVTLLQNDPNPDPRKVIAIYGPERGVKIAQGLAAFHTTPDPADVGQKSQVLRDRMLGLQALNPTLRATVYSGVREKSIADGLIKPEDAPEQYDETWWTQAVNYGKQPTTPPKTPTRQVEVKNPDGSTSIRIVEDTPGQTFESAATPEKGPNVGSFEDYVLRTYGKTPTPAQIIAARKEYNQADDKATGFAAGDVTKLTPAAIEIAARNYLTTGALPPLGMGDKITRQTILNRAGELDPTANVAANKADFGADQASLKNITTTLDSLTAFESTAGKNLDQFLTLAAKIPDTGMPWLNAPVRALTDRMVGSENQAAFNAARDVALREIARVTNDPKLSGVLSDAARQEVSALSPKTATFAQIKKVATVLKQDMANVHSSLTEQRAVIQARMKGGKAATASTVKMKAPNGDTKDVPADQVEHYKSLGAVVLP